MGKSKGDNSSNSKQISAGIPIRAASFIKKRTVEILSRNELSFNERFNELVLELKKINKEVILDGEIVVLDKKGSPQFSLLQNYQRNKEGFLCYYIFDLLYYEGENLTSLPLMERKKRLHNLLELFPSDRLLYSDHVMEKGIPFFKAAAKKKSRRHHR